MAIGLGTVSEYVHLVQGHVWGTNAGLFSLSGAPVRLLTVIWAVD